MIPPPDKPKINVRQNIDDIGVKRLRHPSPVHESEKDNSDAEEGKSLRDNVFSLCIRSLLSVIKI